MVAAPPSSSCRGPSIPAPLIRRCGISEPKDEEAVTAIDRARIAAVTRDGEPHGTQSVAVAAVVPVGHMGRYDHGLEGPIRALTVLRTFYERGRPGDRVREACGWAIERITGEELPDPGTRRVSPLDPFLQPLEP